MKKLVVITGASSGFGREMAKLFAKDDYPLLLLGRRVEKIAELNLKNVIIKNVDVRDYHQLNDAIREAEEIYGKTDLLINNAGVMLLGDLSKQDINEWQNMLDTNVMGVLNGIKVVLEDMKQRNGGTILNVSSIAGRKSFVNHAAYCASKFGVHALSETLREEVSPFNVRIMTIAPGAAETELLTHTSSQEIVSDYNKWKDSMGGKTLDPYYVALSVKYMYEMPQEVNIRELLIACTKQNT